jgi:hypothetical protein
MKKAEIWSKEKTLQHIWENHITTENSQQKKAQEKWMMKNKNPSKQSTKIIRFQTSQIGVWTCVCVPVLKDWIDDEPTMA